METVQKNSKKVFFSGVLLLSVSTVLVKVIGLLYKIPMLSYLGSEGMGYFHSAYEIYALFCMIATAGLPVALSVLISGALAKQEKNRVGHIVRAAWWVFILIGLIGTGLMCVFARSFCTWIRSENAYACILSIAPTVFFVCVSSALRGYFQGYQKMLPTAVSQLLEAVGKLVFGLLFAHLALERGASTPEIAAAAGWGLTLGTAISMLYLIIEKARFRLEKVAPDTYAHTRQSEGYREIWKDLGRLAIPMTLGASLVSLTKLIDMAMILRRLQAIGYTEVMANEAYGSYTTLALSIFGLIPTLLNSVALPLVPMLSAAIASGDREKQTQMISTSYRLTAFFAIPASFGISAFSVQILTLLFGKEPEAVAIAAPLLSILGISVFLSCMITATNSVLHAYRIVKRPILSMLAGAAVKVLVAYALIGNPAVGLMGAPISTFFCNATVVLLNLYFTEGVSEPISVKEIFLRPTVSACLSVGLSYGSYWLLTYYWGEKTVFTLISVILAVFLYLLASFLLGGISKEDLSALPMGEKFSSVFDKIHSHSHRSVKQKSEK